MQLTPKDFWRLTPAAFDAMQRGYERRALNDWRHTRHLANLLRNINRSEDDAASTDAQYLPLPGEVEYDEREAAANVPEKTPEEYAARDERLKARFALVETLESTPV